MRVMLALGAIGVVLIAVVAVLEPLLDEPARRRAETAPPPALAGPFEVAERGRDRPIAELAERLQVDVVVPGRPERASRLTDGTRARRMLRETCGEIDRLNECHEAVSSSAIRHIWASMPRRADPARKAERLLALGDELSLTSVQVRNSIRAELDAQLTRAVRAGEIAERRREAAVTCFDTPAQCRLRGRDMRGPQA